MSADIERVAAQTLWAARFFEHAVHGTGEWTFTWQGITVPAERVVTDQGVRFTAIFPAVCHLGPTDSSGLEIRYEGEVMGYRSPEDSPHPGDVSFVVDWTVLARTDKSVEV